MDIFAGSLPFKITEGELKKLFEQYGTVNSVKIVTDRETKQPKGFAFIEMPNDDEATQAIEAMNGSEVSGRKIVVNKSEKRTKPDFQKTDSPRPKPNPTIAAPIANIGGAPDTKETPKKFSDNKSKNKSFNGNKKNDRTDDGFGKKKPKTDFSKKPKRGRWDEEDDFDDKFSY